MPKLRLLGGKEELLVGTVIALPTTIADVLRKETEARQSKTWLAWEGWVQAENKRDVYVAIKSYELFNQILIATRTPQSGQHVNHASGHTINKVRLMHKHIKSVIEEASK